MYAGPDGHAITSEPNTTLAKVYGRNEGSTANARLIAAAPDLLSRLIEITDVLESAAKKLGDPPGIIDLVICDARAAIVKATGE